MTLSEYLASRDLKPSVFAADLGVPASTITRVLNGERSPGLELMRAIRDKTEGAVQPNDFLPVMTPERFDEMVEAAGLRVTDAPTSPEQPAPAERAA